MKNHFSGEVYALADTLSITPDVPNLTRIEKAIDIALDGFIESIELPRNIQLGVRSFYVRSQSDSHLYYTVEIYDRHRATCTCLDLNVHCKHILAIRIKEELEMEDAWKGFSMNDTSFHAEWASLFPVTGGVR